MITWRDILISLNLVKDERLDDPAVIEVNGDLVNIDLLEVEIHEINDTRLIAYPIKEISDET